MTARFGRLVVAAAALAATPAFAQQGAKQAYDDSTTEGMHEWMRSIAAQIETLRARGASARQIDRLMAEYAHLSVKLGGDDPAKMLEDPNGQPAQGSVTPRVAATSCAGSTPTTTNFVGGGAGAIPNGGTPSGPFTFTTVVSTADTYTWDVNLNLNVTHTFASDLDMSLTSPAGTTIAISTDNGSSNDNVFAGTTFDDNVNDTVTDHVYTNLVVATPLSPEGRLQNFRGEDPNGTWTLSIYDDVAADQGTLNSWSLDISTLSAAPTLTTSTISKSPGLLIPPGAPGTTLGTTTDTQVWASADTYIFEVALYTEITHTSNGDLDMSLTSPGGTTVIFSTDNGSTLDNAFNGTTWDVDAATTVTDAVYTNLVVQPLLSPEGSFDNFLGQDPNGTWTLTIVDDASSNTGTLVRWDLTVTTASAAPTPSAPVNYVGGGTPAAILDPTTINNPLLATASVSGVGTYLWDIDLTADVTHNGCSDLDIHLISPSGTTVAVTTDNGSTLDNVYSGTLWDMQVNDTVMDHVYTNLVTATPLTPEGSFDAFRGEDPNGTWTLSVADDSTGSNTGTLNSWSIDVTTYTAAPSLNSSTFSDTPALGIVDNTTVTDTITVSGIGTQIANVVLYTEITHTWADDLEISLISPAGTTVKVATDVGGSNDDVFNGTTWDPDSTDACTDHVYTNLVVATPMSPEGSFGNFIGQDPNGDWTISIFDDAGGDTGTLARWDLTISTCAAACTVLDICDPALPDVTDGCTPDVSWVGTPDVTECNTVGPSDFVVTWSTMAEFKTCNVILGKGAPLVGPWSTESSRCFNTASYTRTGQQDTGGTGAGCTGSVSLDVEDYLQGGNPIVAPAGIGDDYVVQVWYRDPNSTKTTQMSDAAHFTVCP
jgi:subtilisin-like proprotein convertase family protein